uniref:4-fold beta flower domain-containing protein n=1 Tax=candidate division WOR-3 bacterium TaxID=2052148 RepID=A0A7V3PSU4_UNCW3
MMEKVIFNRFGKATYRLCGTVFYDFMGKPRGFLIGKTVYDLRGTHRGFFIEKVLYDRGGRVIGFVAGAVVNGLELPEVEVPPVPYKDLPAPEAPQNCVELNLPRTVPVWSIMRLENLLV